jgi:F-type H+-transporting ATPase subunit b
MENYNQMVRLFADNSGISLNLDILESGIVNIILLIGIIVYVGGSFIISFLETRQTDIITSIQDAEERLNEAQKRLTEAEKQAKQAKIIIVNTKDETIRTKKFLLNASFIQSKEDLANSFNRASDNVSTKEKQIFLEIKSEIIKLVVERVVARTKEAFTLRKCTQNLTTTIIENLEAFEL